MSGRRFDAGVACVARVPLLPLDVLGDSGATGEATDATIAAQRAWLAALLARPAVREAILVATPALFGELDAWRATPDSERGRKIERALVKYVTRIATRATPYGLCAGVAAGAIDGRGVAIEVGPLGELRRRTRLDNEVLFRLAAALADTADGRAALTWSPNSSLARVAGRWRYAEARAGEQDALRYHLVSVEPTPYLDATLARARSGARLAALAEALSVDEGVAVADARAYVDELAAAQLLVPALGVMVTGPEPIDGLVRQLVDAGLEAPARALGAIRGMLAAIDVAGACGDDAPYDAVARAVEAMFAAAGAPVTIERARLFQVDTVAPATVRIGCDVVAEVGRVVEVLRRTTPRRDDSRLVEFRRAFRARWEDREVPLAEVLDEEAGIGFAAATGPGSEGAPLLAGLPFPTARDGDDATAAWGERERWLLARLAELWAAGGDELVLGEAELRALAAAEPVELPDAWAALVRVARRGDGLALLVEGASGPSGARLLGRFCHLDPRIASLVREHVAREEAHRPDVVFAEVAHLAEGRTGNILCRPVLRAHELVYLGRSGAAPEAQLGVDDLLVSVRGERIVLRSRRLGREVVPRLSSAHNVAAHGLGVYRFLAALQGQDGVGLGWSWGPLADAPRLPRVRIGQVVVARARWRVSGEELRGLAAAAKGGRAAAMAAVQALRAARGLPRHVVLADGDNELWVDLEHALQVDVLVATIGGREQVVLAEAWAAGQPAVARGAEGSYASEVVLAFVRSGAMGRDGARPADAAPRPSFGASGEEARARAGAVERRFAPGSRWLYAKLHAGVSSADRVLREAVAPVVRAALASGAARRWFFIRYADPEPHLRLRLDGEPMRLLTEVLPALHAACAPLLADGTLWRLQLDTYAREVERYGGAAGVEVCEDVFWRDSEAALAIVEQLDGDAGGEARWQLALVGAERLLAALGLDTAARARVFADGKEMLAREHRAGAPLLRAIGERWRAHEARLSRLLTAGRGGDVGGGAGADEPLAPGLVALAARDAALVGGADRLRELERDGALVPGLGGFAWSLVHMSCNRLLHASARAQELVIYELLRRWHGRQRAARGGARAAGRAA